VKINPVLAKPRTLILKNLATKGLKEFGLPMKPVRAPFCHHPKIA